jgi:ubiquinone/menaquinone biosynthesis C-methylase UbiE
MKAPSFFIVSVFFVLLSGFYSECFAQNHQPEPKTPDQWTTRSNWQMPVRVMKEIGVKEGMTVADIGANEGYFTFYLAEKVGHKGKVFATDIDDNALQTIRNRMKNENVNNITVINGKEDDPMLPAKSMDIALIVNVIPVLSNPPAFLKTVAKCLKPGGKLVIVQWAAEKIDREVVDWENPYRNSLRFYLRQIYDSGFEVVQIMNFLPLQNIYICKQRQ